LPNERSAIISSFSRGAPDAPLPDMPATQTVPDIHLQAGARWIAPFLGAIFLSLLAIFAMLVYPHITG
jgi:hypothetical protein